MQRTEAPQKRPLFRHSMNAGWLNVERSMYGGIDHFETENLQVFDGGWLEVCKYDWSRPIETIWTTDRRCYLLHMWLGGHETASVVTNSRTGESHELDSTGKIHLVPPEQTMRCTSQKGELRSLRCMLDAGLVESFLNTVPMWDWGRVPLREEVQLGGGEIEWVLRRMYREVREPDFASVSVLETLAKQLAVEILRRFRPHCADRNCFVGGLASRHKRLIRERLHSPRPLPSREELADLCNMTVRHLSRAFRTETGQTLGKHIESVMVERAKAQLLAGAPVRDVAAAIGYATASSFTAAFRRATGLLPSDIRTGVCSRQA
jgi:AraC family transcriptional regulator